MALPSSGEIKASQINTEADRSSDAEAPLSGSSSTPQAGSLVKIYEGAGVNQSAPHSYSEFYGKSFVQGLELTNLFVEDSPLFSGYYDSSIGDASNLSVGDVIYSDSSLTTKLYDNPGGSDQTYNQSGTASTTTHCPATGGYLMRMDLNATTSEIELIQCDQL
jgi:hypothetical protein